MTESIAASGKILADSEKKRTGLLLLRVEEDSKECEEFLEKMRASFMKSLSVVTFCEV